MYIEWAALCGRAMAGTVGLNVERLGENGYDLSGRTLPQRVWVAFIVCFRMEPGDEGGSEYHFIPHVIGPDGQARPPHLPIRVVNRPETSPQLIDPERLYLPIEIDFVVNEPGQYTIRLFDATGERFALPVLFVALPSPE